MAIGSVWFPESLSNLLGQIMSRLDGNLPIINVITDQKPDGPAAFHKPTFYPELNVPNGPEGDWGEVASGMFHVLLSLDGIPELLSYEPQLAGIAREINCEIHQIAFNLSGIEPKPLHTANLIDTANELLKNSDNHIDGDKVMFTIKLLRHQLAGHPQANDALTLLKNHIPDEFSQGRELFLKLISLPLKQPLGKDQACGLLIEGIGLNKNDFVLRSTRFFNGICEYRPIEYNQHLESAHRQFFEYPFPYAWLQFKLPFAIPVIEGAYHLKEGMIFLRHHVVSNDNASWKSGENTIIDTLISPSGLYKQTTVEVLLPGRLAVNDTLPPNDNLVYKNLSSYPEAVIQATTLVNKFLTALRRKTGRCDIPEVIPSHFNQIVFKQFDERGETEKSTSLSFEYNIFTENPQLDSSDMVSTEVKIVEDITFYLELLETAKLHLLSYNLRRAVLDFCGSFENFVHTCLPLAVEKTKNNSKGIFLKRYKTKLDILNKSLVALIENIPEDNDKKTVAPIRVILEHHKKSGNLPVIDGDLLEHILKLFDYRNDAAHGRPITGLNPEDIEKAIESYETIITGEEMYLNARFNG